MSKILIVESGSTKADWVVLDKTSVLAHHRTSGINPSTQDDYLQIVSDIFPQSIFDDIHEVHYYGAGVKGQNSKNRITDLLSSLITTNPLICIENDLLAAARATSFTEESIISILGTGSNSAYYDGKILKQNIPSLGFILSDEGAGSNLGRQIVKAYYYGQLPENIKRNIEAIFAMNLEEILSKVYRSPNPAAFLASFTMFLDPQEELWAEELIRKSFQEFIDLRIKTIENHNTLKCHFVGSIAYTYRELLSSKLEENNLIVGEILKTPLEALLKFHQKLMQ